MMNWKMRDLEAEKENLGVMLQEKIFRSDLHARKMLWRKVTKDAV